MAPLFKTCKTLFVVVSGGLCSEWSDAATLTALYQATKGHDNEGIDQLVNANTFASAVLARSSDGRGLTWWAYEFQNEYVLGLILAYGGDIHSVQQDEHGVTAAQMCTTNPSCRLDSLVKKAQEVARNKAVMKLGCAIGQHSAGSNANCLDRVKFMMEAQSDFTVLVDKKNTILLSGILSFAEEHGYAWPTSDASELLKRRLTTITKDVAASASWGAALGPVLETAYCTLLKVSGDLPTTTVDVLKKIGTAGIECTVKKDKKRLLMFTLGTAAFGALPGLVTGVMKVVEHQDVIALSFQSRHSWSSASSSFGEL